MTRVLIHARRNAVAYLALFVSLCGTSYAAFNLPAGSVGNRELRNRAITAAKLNPTSVAASVRAWANLTWAGGWRVQASSSDIQVSSIALGEAVKWRHTRFARNCMASVTPTLNLGAAQFRGGTVATSFDPRAGHLTIFGTAPNGTVQQQSVNVLIVCPTSGSQKVNR